MGQPLTGNSQQIWSVNGQLLSEILECSDTDKPLDPSGDIFGPSLSKDSVLYASISTSPDREFALIGAPGISGHKTVAKELVTYPPDQLRAQADPNMYYISPSPPVDLPGLIADQNLGVLDASDNVSLQQHDYGRAIENWAEFQPSMNLMPDLTIAGDSYSFFSPRFFFYPLS